MAFLAVVAVAVMAAAAHAASFSGMVVFGDSLSDTGNLFAFTSGQAPPSPPYFEGRSSNGPIWIERLQQRLDIDPTQVLNFATGGATTGRANITVAEAPGLLAQIDAFAASGSPVDPQALYVVWAGSNDFLGDSVDPEATITAAVANIATAISTLAALGASRFLAPGLPDLGKAPVVRELGDPTSSAGATAVAIAFNHALATTLDDLETTLAIDIIPLDLVALFEAIAADPEAFGVVNFTDRCLSADLASLCDMPALYLYWDGLHPTATGHNILANAAAEAVIDSNGDGIPDSRASLLGLDPFVADGDSDGDAIADIDEVGDLNNPIDTDGDGLIDAVEPGDAAADPLALVFRVPSGPCCTFPAVLVGKTVSLTANGAHAIGSVNNPDVGLPIYSEDQVGDSDSDFLYPLGLYYFTLQVPSGEKATVVIQFAADVDIPEDAVYRQVDATGRFITDHSAVIDRVNKTVTLMLTDGGSGDEDSSADGLITATGGVGKPFNLGDGGFSIDGGSGPGGCFIATAAYGSYEAPLVQILRRFRDQLLLPNAPGRWLVKLYYAYSPPAAAWIAQRAGWRWVVRIALLPLIGIAWLLTETPVGVQILVGLVLTALLWRMARWGVSRYGYNWRGPKMGRLNGSA